MIRAIEYSYDSFESGYDCILLIDEEPAAATDFPATVDDVYNLADSNRPGRAILPGSILLTPGFEKVWHLGFDGVWKAVE